MAISLRIHGFNGWHGNCEIWKEYLAMLNRWMTKGDEIYQILDNNLNLKYIGLCS